MSFSETIFLFVLALVVFGPKKLPEIARQIGKVLNEFRRASNEFKSQIEQEIAHLEVEDRKQTVLASSPTPEGTASRSLSAGGELPATLAASADNLEATVVSAGPGALATEAHPSETQPTSEPQPEVQPERRQESHA